jgi:hypothetical protein
MERIPNIERPNLNDYVREGGNKVMHCSWCNHPTGIYHDCEISTCCQAPIYFAERNSQVNSVMRDVCNFFSGGAGDGISR